MPTAPGSDARWPAGLVLVFSTIVIAVGFLVLPADGRTRVVAAEALVASACAVSAWVIWVIRRQGGGWMGAGYLGAAVALLGAADVWFLVTGVAARTGERTGPWDLAFLVLGLPLALAIRQEFRTHFHPDTRREIWVDVLLVTVSLTVISYLLLRPEHADGAMASSAAVFAFLAALQFAAFGGLAAWVPSPMHLVQFVIFTVFAATTAYFGWEWVNGTFRGASLPVDLGFAVGAVVLAAFVGWIPAGWIRGSAARISRWGRPVLTSTAVAAALTALALVATGSDAGGISDRQASWLIGALGACVILRIVANQIRSTQASERVRLALEQKEGALRETDAALERVREANDTLRESEEHVRLVLEAASDGIVELDANDEIVRVNEAFCAMVGFPREVVEGQPWTALAAAVRGADPSFASLPTTGQGEIQREGQPLYLESRTSEVPLDPPRRLMLVRDVTAARVADQTIRSLFQFLQDRDEDRTRILRRMNAAIESERNRVARDLHDGPVQGVSAASLSLEAALLMIKAGDLERGIDVLGRIRKELSDEADALRRLMSGLRPPLLEERGLIPALREMVARFGADQDVETSFQASAVQHVPNDLETIAYRVVQEALANCAKHAKATHVSVSVEADATQLRVEIVDDGVGFDSGQGREFLRMGRVGLASMRERVELANGTFLVHPTLGRGTTILATLPLDVVSIRDLTPSEADAR
jgi:PAS domain S-box-containing protein